MGCRGRRPRARHRGLAALCLAAVLPPIAASGDGPPGAPPAEAREAARRLRVWLEQDEWQRAMTRGADWIESHAGDPDVVACWGALLLRAGRLAEAETRLEPVVEADGAPPLALVTLGRLRAARGRQGEAVALMERALASAPDDPEILYWAARASASRARTVEILRRYLAAAPERERDRIQAVRGTLRTYGALGDRPVWVVAERPERSELPLRALPGGEGRPRGYVLHVAVGDDPRKKPLRMLLDTGSTGLFVLERSVRRRGFAALAETTAFGGGGGKRHDSRQGLLPSLALGALRFEDALVSATRAEIEPTGRYVGLVGLSVFEGYTVVLDLSESRLRLEPPEPEPGGLPYWRFAGQVLVEASAGDGTRGLFLLDTGATRTLLSTPWAESLAGARIGDPVTVRGYGGRLAGARAVRGVRLEFAGRVIGERPLLTADLALRSRLTGVEIAGFLGLDALDGRRVEVDTVHHTVRVAEIPR